MRGKAIIYHSKTFIDCKMPIYGLLPILPLDPRHEEIDDSPLPLGGDGDPARHSPPLREAVAAAAGTSVLGDEHGVPAHRRLLPVVRRICGRETRSDEVLAVRANRLHSLLCDVLPVRSREMEATPELRLRQPREYGIIAVYQISTHVGL